MKIDINGVIREMTPEEEKEYQAMIVESPLARIKVLKEQLEALDYKTNKYVEGNLSEEEWQETIAQRQAYREEINRLENLL